MKLVVLCILVVGCIARRGLHRRSGISSITAQTPKEWQHLRGGNAGKGAQRAPRRSDAHIAVFGPLARPRVVDGVSDDLNEYPYVVSIQSYSNETAMLILFQGYTRTCSGSLIHHNWVLTAGHCLDGGKYVRYGNMTVPPNATTSYRKIIKTFPYPSYRINEGIGLLTNDIGLVLIEKISSLPFGRLSAVEPQAMLGHAVRYAGFGYTYLDTDTDHVEDYIELWELHEKKPLQIGEAVVKSCDSDAYGVICLSPKCSKRTNLPFKGDSGGPLIYNGRIAGVCSTVNPFELTSTYTPVARYLDWITSTLATERP